MARAVLLSAVIFLVVSACGGAEDQQGSQAPSDATAVDLPKDDPARGIYNYEHAKAVGIPVPRIPSPDEICPPPTPDNGFSSEELDTPEEIAAIERQMATAASCTVDPRLAVIVVGYSVEEVRAAGSAYERGKLICSAPGVGATLFRTRAPDPGEGINPETLMKTRLQRAYGVEASDDVDELVRGCATTGFGQTLLRPRE